MSSNDGKFPLPRGDDCMDAEGRETQGADSEGESHTRSMGDVREHSADDIAIRVQNLSKCYQIYDRPEDRLRQSLVPRLQRLIGRPPTQYAREFWALKELSFDVKKGETVGIIGRNGAGKSTLLQLICGTLSPTSGEVEVKGRVAALLELGSGFNPEFTGRENVYLNGAILGFSRGEIEARIDAILAFADIGDFIDQPVKVYSSGMLVRLAFSVQASLDPDVLIVDEALAVGDAHFVHKCMLRFHQLRERGTTILLVTHDATAVKTLCNRAIWIDQGSIAAVGQTSTVVDRYLAAVRGQPVYIDFSGRELGSVISQAQSAGSEQDAEERVIPNIDRRVGNQSCAFIGVGLYDDRLRKLKAIPNNSVAILRVTFRNRLLEQERSIVLGYSLRNNRGVDIASSNSEVEKAEINAPAPGETMTVRMRIHIPELHSGSYAFSVSLGYRDLDGRMNSADGVTNAVVFDLVSERTVHVLMSLRTEYEVEG